MDLQASFQQAFRHCQAGELGLAERLYREIVERDPTNSRAHCNLGGVLRDQRRLHEAAACFERAIALEPDLMAASLNLGNTQFDLGNPERALPAYARAAELAPGSADAHYGLSLVYAALGRYAEQISALERAIELRPGFAAAHNNLGIVLHSQGRVFDAIQSFHAAVRIDPGHAFAWSNLGNALASAHRFSEAIAALKQSCRLQPDSAEPLSNLALVHQNMGRIEEAVDAYRQALGCEPERAEVHSNLLMCLCYVPAIDPDSLFQEHCRWNAVHAARVPRKSDHRNALDPERRLRIGYVSPDFHKHPVASFVEPFFKHHDHDQFEIFAYADVALPDHVTERLAASSDRFTITCGMTHQQLADRVAADEIDILVDLAGHTRRHRLLCFACKPAPIQMTYLGYPGTTGLSAVDYRLTDMVVDPPDMPTRSSEKLVYLESFCVYEPPSAAPAVSPLPAKATGRVTFGSLHKLAKINTEVIGVWARLLEDIPESRILMFRDVLVEETRNSYLRLFEQHGADLSRIEFRSDVPAGSDYLSLYHEVDICLDTFPWGGHTTACEAMWMGVPVVAYRGSSSAGRLVASVLGQLGMAAWSGASPEEYVARSKELAGDLDRLAGIRAGLRDRMMASPLCNASRFTRNLEGIYREKWRAWCRLWG